MYGRDRRADSAAETELRRNDGRRETGCVGGNEGIGGARVGGGNGRGVRERRRNGGFFRGVGVTVGSWTASGSDTGGDSTAVSTVVFS